MHIKSSVDSQDDTVLIDTTTGKLKADLIDAKTVVAEGIDAKTIVAEGISGQTINADNATISNLNIENVVINGSYRSGFSKISLNTEENKFSDNMSLVPYGITTFNIKHTDIGQVGRVIRFVKNIWHDEKSYYGSILATPPGYYFYENGFETSSLTVGNECITLLGLGDDEKFQGWLVLSRVDICPTNKRGSNKKILAIGGVTGTPTGATIWYRTFDGSKMSVERNGTGVYTIKYDITWYERGPFVMLTGVGCCYDDSGKMGTSPSKASLYEAFGGTIVVHVSDDSTNNDGSFNFEISSTTAFGDPS